jgi:hypothetical protein
VIHSTALQGTPKRVWSYIYMYIKDLDTNYTHSKGSPATYLLVPFGQLPDYFEPHAFLEKVIGG